MHFLYLLSGPCIMKTRAISVCVFSFLQGKDHFLSISKTISLGDQIPQKYTQILQTVNKVHIKYMTSTSKFENAHITGQNHFIAVSQTHLVSKQFSRQLLGRRPFYQPYTDSYTPSLNSTFQAYKNIKSILKPQKGVQFQFVSIIFEQFTDRRIL